VVLWPVGAAGSPAGGRDPRQGGIGGHSSAWGSLAKGRVRDCLEGRSDGWGRSVRTCRRDTEKSGQPWPKKKGKIRIQLVYKKEKKRKEILSPVFYQPYKITEKIFTSLY
jgi:hypothetical protein